jgi:hypothetical protein
LIQPGVGRREEERKQLQEIEMEGLWEEIRNEDISVHF